MITGNILITGGSGTIGNAIVKRGKAEDWPCRFTIFSRSEFLQAVMRSKHPNCRYILGDVRDAEAVSAAIAGHDIVIHAAAMKRIPECEEQPEECFKTNVTGSLNVVKACVQHDTELCIGLSTDKACQPVTTYGASKLMMERIFQAYAEYGTFKIVRYGNVIESRGSVIPIWKQQHAEGKPLTVTDIKMTRFWISPDLAVNYILRAAKIQNGGVLVPKMSALSLVDMGRAICPDSQMVQTGLRSMERIHEFLVSPDETATEYHEDFVISAAGKMGHLYRSDNAPQWNPGSFLKMIGEK